MPTADRKIERSHRGVATIETYVDGEGRSLVILPSYGRDGGVDFDDITGHLVRAGWRVLRPQPRGVAGSSGPMSGVSLHDLADDIAAAVEKSADGPVVLLGHAYGNLVARALATDHPNLVKAVVLAAAQCSHVPPHIARAPFIAGDPTCSEDERLEALREAFFAPGNDASIWLNGWYPETLKMQRAALEAVSQDEYWGSGTAPILELIPAADAFKPKAFWHEMRDAFGTRVTTTVIDGAGHALFPEQPEAVGNAILAWTQSLR